ncbi:sterol desaturase family protein [Pannus brasiliensis CCIBt3594]|uniref:Sterol desaturase family protein n=1 Tax=Pannus brasiliensis CCIBt3594 TaxID=1427578 RepID=A0AAW9QY29_9CHRO
MITLILKALSIALALLLLGDSISTFLYHVPEHVFGKFHAEVHHGKNRNFFHYAVLTRNPWVLLDGFLGALPYFIFVPWFWTISPVGTILGLILGELHVIWRHVSILNWGTPVPIARICDRLYITTPERHWLHHQNAMVAYGDIFTFYDRPAHAWLSWLTAKKKELKSRARDRENAG